MAKIKPESDTKVKAQALIDARQLSQKEWEAKYDASSGDTYSNFRLYNPVDEWTMEQKQNKQSKQWRGETKGLSEAVTSLLKEQGYSQLSEAVKTYADISPKAEAVTSLAPAGQSNLPQEEQVAYNNAKSLGFTGSYADWRQKGKPKSSSAITGQPVIQKPKSPSNTNTMAKQAKTYIIKNGRRFAVPSSTVTRDPTQETGYKETIQGKTIYTPATQEIKSATQPQSNLQFGSLLQKAQQEAPKDTFDLNRFAQTATPAQKQEVRQLETPVREPLLLSQEKTADVTQPSETPATQAKGSLSDILASIGISSDTATTAPTGQTGDLSSLQQLIIEALQPTEKETALQEQINQSKAGLRQGEQNIEQQAIPMPFITGQRAALQKQAGISQANLLDELALLQQQRATKGNVATAMAGFAESAEERAFRERQFGAQQQQQAFSNKLATATAGLRYDPETGQFYRDESLSEPTDPSEIAKLTQGIRKEFFDQDIVKGFTVLAGQYNRVLGAMEQLNQNPNDSGLANFADQALITIFNKIMDPTSVVRESEYARTPEGLGAIDRIEAFARRIKQGGVLEPDARKAGVDIIKKFIDSAKIDYDNQVDFFTQISNAAKVDPNLVINSPYVNSSDLGSYGEDTTITGTNITDMNLLSKGGDFNSIEEKVADIIQAVKQDYSQQDIIDFYKISPEQYLAIVSRL